MGLVSFVSKLDTFQDVFFSGPTFVNSDAVQISEPEKWSFHCDSDFSCWTHTHGHMCFISEWQGVDWWRDLPVGEGGGALPCGCVGTLGENSRTRRQNCYWGTGSYLEISGAFSVWLVFLVGRLVSIWPEETMAGSSSFWGDLQTTIHSKNLPKLLSIGHLNCWNRQKIK